MKSLFASLMIFGATIVGVSAQTSPLYLNDGVVTYLNTAYAPQIDAETFVNNGTFNIIFTNYNNFNTELFDFSNTRNFENYGLMTFMPGVHFDRAPSGTGLRVPADNFLNYGNIDINSAFYFINGVTFFFGGFGFGEFRCEATNIVNRGLISVGNDSLVKVRGKTVDLAGSGLLASTSDQVLAGYWGLGTNDVSPQVYFEFFTPPFTPLHWVTNRANLSYQTELYDPTVLSYLDETISPSGSNRFVRAVFLANTNPAVLTEVYFPPSGEIRLHWQATQRGYNGVTTNNVWLSDTYGIRTNQQLRIWDFAGSTPTYMPVNYTWTIGDQFLNFGTPASPVIIPADTFAGPNGNPQTTAFEGLFLPTAQPLEDVKGRDVTNMTGRIEIAADDYMDLTDAAITSSSYMLLKSTNNFGGSARASIAAPFSDIYLRSTNKTFAITNLMNPYINRPEGIVDLFSMRWTNVVAGVTNSFHVLYAVSGLNLSSPTRIQDLVLRSPTDMGGADEMLISDQMYITRSLTVDTTRLTITTNDTDALVPTGGLNISAPGIVWATATPRLLYLTNYGVIEATNAMYFGDKRSSPYFASPFHQPYEVFVNAGAVTNFGSIISAKTFLNSGTVYTVSGNIELKQNEQAILQNGAFVALSGGVLLNSGSLFASNQTIVANRPYAGINAPLSPALTLAPTALLDDGSLATSSADAITNKNTWVLGGGGFSLLSRPAQGSLLGTTINTMVTRSAGTITRVPLQWAGVDRGNTAAGYVNNSALGRLILDGQVPSQFVFFGIAPGSAIYIDSLELVNYAATNRDTQGNFLSLAASNNITVYFGQALANGLSVAEKVNGSAGGRFVWVSGYNTGFYSSTNVVYPDGTTNRLNTALVTSCDIDSDNDGLVNCNDPTPIPVLSPAGLAMTVTYSRTPAPKAVVSWNSIPFSTNYLYATTSMLATNWQLVTNFVQGPANGRVTVSDPIAPNAPRFYRVKADAPRP